jgi:hypothetical protein
MVGIETLIAKNTSGIVKAYASTTSENIPPIPIDISGGFIYNATNGSSVSTVTVDAYGRYIGFFIALFDFTAGQYVQPFTFNLTINNSNTIQINTTVLNNPFFMNYYSLFNNFIVLHKGDTLNVSFEPNNAFLIDTHFYTLYGVLYP